MGSVYSADCRNFLGGRLLLREQHSAKTDVPIGLIESDWGGTPAESWTSLAALANDSSLMPIFASRAKMTEGEIMNRLVVQQEEKEKAAAKAEGRAEPKYPWHPPLNSWEPAALYNAMVAPLTPFPMRGVIWYQGESNSLLDRAPMYERLFQTMIRDWRHRWDDPNCHSSTCRLQITPRRISKIGR